MLQNRLLFCAATAAAQQHLQQQQQQQQAAPQSGAAPSSTNGGSASQPVSPETVTVNFNSFGAVTPHQQREALRLLIRGHEAAVQQNTVRRDSHFSTYDQDSCAFFPYYQLASLPPTTGGVHRAAVRAALVADNGPLCALEEGLLRPWREAGERAVVVFGAKSIPYLKRQLVTDDAHTFLVVDHSLKALANAAAALAQQHGPRVHFLRSDAMFTTLSVLPRASVDTVVAPMPAPFWSEKGSYRRLVTSDFICAVHRILRERTDTRDARGFVTFTDCEPYADFVVEQLTEAKLLVPWMRKNPQEVYGRWLPLSMGEGNDGAASEGPTTREFTQQRFRQVVAVAASKCGPTSEQTLSFIEGFDYKRRYYRAFNDGSG